VAEEQACPSCGVFSAQVHSRWVQRIKDLPYGRPLQVRWRKRRWACDEPACRRRTFSESNDQVGPGRLLTRRSLRSAADVAREYDVS
jgi:transposase